MTLVTSDMFDAILSSVVDEQTTGFRAAQLVKKDNYEQLTSHQNLLTYSTSEILHACPRKYMLRKMRADAGTSVRHNSATFSFGHAVGAGVAVYDQTQNLREAIWAAFLSWDIDLLDESEEKKGKTFTQAIWALYAYRTFHADETDLSEYEVVKIEGTIAIDFEDGHFYSGHVDEVLRHKTTGRYRVKENKTTGLTNIDLALYANSNQGLSYAVVVDMLGASEYDVLYTIYSCGQQKWIAVPFTKTTSQKAEWIQDQLLTQQQVDQYSELNFFPKRGGSCFQFMRRCEEFETCTLSPLTVFGKRFDELPRIQSLDDIENLEHIDFPTTLSEIVARQKAKIREA